MNRPHTVLVLAALSALACSAAMADALPHRRAGQWETFMHPEGQAAKGMKSQQCIDDKSDEAMQRLALEGSAAMHCERSGFIKIPGGFESSSICKSGRGTITNKMRVIGDMQSAYRVEVASHRDPPVAGQADTRTVMEAKWLSACPADLKPGDMRVNGMTMHPGMGMGGVPGAGAGTAAGGMGGMDPKAIGSMSPAERMEYMKKLMEARSQQQQ